MIKRNHFQLDNLSFSIGAIGHLAVLNVIPVIAGDSISLNMLGSVRLTPFRRNIVMDSRYDVFSFFVPHRLSYMDISSAPDNYDTPINVGKWIDFVKSIKTTSSTTTLPTENIGWHFMPWCDTSNTVPRWFKNSYLWIWNRYFRHVDYPKRDLKTSYKSEREVHYGFVTPRLPSIWTTGISPSVMPHNDEMVNVSVKDSKWSLVEARKQEGLYTSLVNETWFGRYYNDLVRKKWGGKASADVDWRPHLISATRTWISGHNIFGTSNQNIGQAVGRCEAPVRHTFPRRFFGEHGSIYVVAVLRFPTIHEREKHYLIGHDDYESFAADPEVFKTTPPIQMQVKDLFVSNHTGNLTNIPFGDWYRFQPNHVHNKFDDLNGYPFLTREIANNQGAYMHVEREYDEIFQSNAAQHWNSSFRFNVSAHRPIPKSAQSLYAGAE